MFLQVSVCPHGGVHGGGGHAWWQGGVRGCKGVHSWGEYMVEGGVCCCGGCAWLWGACMIAGGVCGCGWACMVAGGLHGCRGDMCSCGGHAWLQGGMHGCGEHAWWQWGACVVAGEGMHVI